MLADLLAQLRQPGLPRTAAEVGQRGQARHAHTVRLRTDQHLLVTLSRRECELEQRAGTHEMHGRQ